MSHSSHLIKCKHKLEYCEQCDVVFCSSCKEEWKKSWTTFAYYSPNTTITMPVISGTQTVSSHVHNQPVQTA